MIPIKVLFRAGARAAETRLAILAVFLMVGVAFHAAAQTVIDDFRQGQATLTGVGSSTQAGLMIGGERDLALSVSAGAISAGVSVGLLKISGDGAADGTVEVVWDGADNDAATLADSGLGVANLTAGGDNAFLLGINSLSGSPSLTLTVFSGANSSTIPLSGLGASTLPQLVR